VGDLARKQGQMYDKTGHAKSGKLKQQPIKIIQQFIFQANKNKAKQNTQ